MTRTLVFIVAGLALFSALMVAWTPKQVEDGRTTLTWVSDANPQRIPQIEEFNEMHPDLNLKLDTGNASVMKVVIQCSAGMGPDLIGHVNSSSFSTYRDAGILLDITEVAKEMGIGPDSLPEGMRDAVMMRDPETLEMRQYVYPANLIDSIIIYNKDLFDEYGIPYPSKDLTWDEYVDIAQRLTKYDHSGARVPSVFGGAGADFLGILWSFGGDVMDKDGTRSRLTEERATDAAVFLHDLYFKHGIEPTPTQVAGVSSQGGWASGGSYINWFVDGKLAMFFGSRWMLIQFRRHFEDWINEGKALPRMGAAFVPRLAEGKRYSRAAARGVGVNAKSPRREDALEFLKYLSSEPYSALINQGGDGVAANKKYLSMEDLKHPDWPGEEEIDELTVESLDYARFPVSSLFIDQGTVDRLVRQIQDQLVSSEHLNRGEISRILERASRKIDAEIARSTSRDPVLKRAHAELVKRASENQTEGDRK